MENELKKLLRIQKWEYAGFWILNLGLIVLYECNVLPQGVLTTDPRTAYAFQVIGILLTIGLVPFALRLFKVHLSRYLAAVPKERLLKSYGRWSEVRLVALLAPAMFDITVYYATLDSAGLLCAGMVALASLFCVPSHGRMLSEMNLDAENPEK